MNADERQATLEVQMAQLTKAMNTMAERMDRMNERLEIVARLEERWQSLDQRLGVLTQSFERELQRRSRIDDNLFDRVRVLESGSNMNSHGREMAERVALVILGGLALYTIQMMWGG